MNLSQIRDFQHRLHQWYDAHHRPLPWRDTTDPYRIWLSEVILQQTRVAQGMEYYHRFVERFPDVFSLASASSPEVYKLWEGLGYYRRARHLHLAAQKIVQEMGGVFPSSYREILSLPGVGAYTAGAIASFAFDLPVVAVDGNVLRVLSRLWASDLEIDTTEGAKGYRAWAQTLLDTNHPAQHNQAMIELGALICTPTSPHCSDCPVHEFCLSVHSPLANQLPKKQGKVKVKQRNLHYYLPIFLSESQEFWIPMRSRSDTDIWASLFEFPLVETSTQEPPALEELFSELGITVQEVLRQESLPSVQHKLTHRTLEISFTLLFLREMHSEWKAPWQNIHFSSLAELPAFPVPIARVVQSLIETYAV